MGTSVALLLLSLAVADERFVGPAGRPDNAGTRESPWDIESALAGRLKVAPDDTILLLEGTYRRRPKELYEVKLVGTAEQPVHVRPAPGARVTIDGGLAVLAPSAHVWIRDLEILVAEPLPEKPVSAGSHPKDLVRPHGGLHLHGGRNCKYINLVIHDTHQAISAWRGEIDPEIYGCLLYGNGWQGVDRGHGHCIYTQNKEGVKTISNCIMSARFDGAYTMHAYGSSAADVDNFLLEGNIAYGRGPFLVGGGKPSRGIRVFRNVLYGVNLQLGYSAPHNEDCEVRDNLVVNGGLAINKFNKVVSEGNVTLAKGAARPAEPRVALFLNKYDPDRAHLAIFRWTGAGEVAVNVQAFLKPGDLFRLHNPQDVHGKPVQEGRCEGEAIAVPVKDEFSVFVARRIRP